MVSCVALQQEAFAFDPYSGGLSLWILRLLPVPSTHCQPLSFNQSIPVYAAQPAQSIS